MKTIYKLPVKLLYWYTILGILLFSPLVIFGYILDNKFIAYLGLSIASGLCVYLVMSPGLDSIRKNVIIKDLMKPKKDFFFFTDFREVSAISLTLALFFYLLSNYILEEKILDPYDSFFIIDLLIDFLEEYHSITSIIIFFALDFYLTYHNAQICERYERLYQLKKHNYNKVNLINVIDISNLFLVKVSIIIILIGIGIISVSSGLIFLIIFFLIAFGCFENLCVNPSKMDKACRKYNVTNPHKIVKMAVGITGLAIGAATDLFSSAPNGDDVSTISTLDDTYEDTNIDTEPLEPYNPNPEIINIESYQRSDGTWVDGHSRTVPDDYISNNLGSRK